MDSKKFDSLDELYEYIEKNNLSDEEAEALFESMGDKFEDFSESDYDETDQQDWDDPSGPYDSAVKVYMNETRRIPILPKDQQIKLFETYKSGDKNAASARKKIIECNLPLVISIAKKYRNRGLPFEDLIQEGNLGLMRAIEKFDVNNGAAFTTYATYWINQKILRALAETSTTIHIPVSAYVDIKKMRQLYIDISDKENRTPSVKELAQKLKIPEAKARDYATYLNENNYLSLNAPMSENDDTTLSEVIADEEAVSPGEDIGNDELLGVFAEILKNFSEKEQTVIKLRFGLTGDPPMTLEEVGNNLNVTRERVRQIESKALRKLRSPKYARLLADFRN